MEKESIKLEPPLMKATSQMISLSRRELSPAKHHNKTGHLQEISTGWWISSPKLTTQTRTSTMAESISRKTQFIEQKVILYYYSGTYLYGEGGGY